MKLWCTSVSREPVLQRVHRAPHRSRVSIPFSHRVSLPAAHRLDGCCIEYSVRSVRRRGAAHGVRGHVLADAGALHAAGENRVHLVHPTRSAAHSKRFGGSRAGGGDVLANRGYWVGEQGPEWFQPRTAGTVLPHEESMQRARGAERRSAPTVINVAVEGRVERQTRVQIGTEVDRSIQRSRRIS